MLGIGVFVAPVIWLTGNPILGYDVAFLLTSMIAGCGLYLLVRELIRRYDAAFLAGLTFTFGPVRALHVSHLQVLACSWMPIALWGLHRYFSRRSLAALAAFVAAFTIQAMSNGYFLYYLSIAAVIVVVYELFVGTTARGQRLRALAPLVIAVAIILVFFGTIAVSYLAVRKEYGFTRPYQDWTMFSADARSYLTAPATALLWRPLLHGDGAPERQLFPGLVVLIGPAVALWPGRARRGTAALYAAIAMTAFILSLGPEPTAWSHRLCRPVRSSGWFGSFRGWMVCARRRASACSWCCRSASSLPSALRDCSPHLVRARVQSPSL